MLSNLRIALSELTNDGKITDALEASLKDHMIKVKEGKKTTSIPIFSGISNSFMINYENIVKLG